MYAGPAMYALSEDYLRSKGIDLELSESNKSEFATHVYAQCALDA